MWGWKSKNRNAMICCDAEFFYFNKLLDYCEAADVQINPSYCHCWNTGRAFKIDIPKCKRRVFAEAGSPGSSQSSHPVGCSRAAPGWCPPPSSIGGPGSTRPGETQVLKGHFCLCNQRGVGGPRGVSNQLNVVCDTRHRAEKNMQQSQQLGEQINSHAKSQQVSFHGWSTLKRHLIFLRLILGDVSGWWSSCFRVPWGEKTTEEGLTEVFSGMTTCRYSCRFCLGLWL